MTEPLTPPEADLQDFPFMPLHVARLRDSDQAAEVHPEACWYAVMLWAASWHQLPAGSLPDNETVLTRLCGLGRDVKTFRKHRAGAMRGFVLCNDGRWYHPTVAEQVHAAWEQKLQQRWRTECARIKKANQRNGTELPSPTYEAFVTAMSSGQNEPCPDVVPGDSAECPPGQSLQERGTGTGTGNISSEEGKPSSASEPLSIDDPGRTAWALATQVLTQHGGMTEAAARRFFGKLLSDHKLEARELLGSVAGAVSNGTGDPKAYLTRAAQGVAKRKAEPVEPKRVAFV